ncbi:MAG: 5-formyltetrahydrofolate cyclo-ligase [Nitrososphaerota archaeon]
MSNEQIMSEKQRIRMLVWNKLEESGVATFPKPIFGRIPNFIGASRAAALLCSHDIYRSATVVKVSPDSPQKFVRMKCLMDGKRLIMPTPRIRNGFLMIDPENVPKDKIDFASTIRGSYVFGKKTELEYLPKIDLIVVGSVAVTKDGWRLGKGEGYSEIEYAMFRMLNKISEDTPITTTVHELQIVEYIPYERYDVPVDYIFTNNRVIEVLPRRPRPSGIIWSLLSPRKLGEIPLLERLRKGYIK